MICLLPHQQKQRTERAQVAASKGMVLQAHRDLSREQERAAEAEARAADYEAALVDRTAEVERLNQLNNHLIDQASAHLLHQPPLLLRQPPQCSVNSSTVVPVSRLNRSFVATRLPRRRNHSAFFESAQH